jgi:hypothetical protein
MASVQSLRANIEEMFVLDRLALRDAAVATAIRLDHAFAENILADLARSDAAEVLQSVADSALPVLSIQSPALGPDMKRRSLEPGEWGKHRAGSPR